LSPETKRDKEREWHTMKDLAVILLVVPETERDKEREWHTMKECVRKTGEATHLVSRLLV
jgi:hypothetical protein